MKLQHAQEIDSDEQSQERDEDQTRNKRKADAAGVTGDQVRVTACACSGGVCVEQRERRVGPLGGGACVRRVNRAQPSKLNQGHVQRERGRGRVGKAPLLVLGSLSRPVVPLRPFCTTPQCRLNGSGSGGAAGPGSGGGAGGMTDEMLMMSGGENGSNKKARVVWSVEMHQQFVNAVNQLGIDSECPVGAGGAGGDLRRGLWDGAMGWGHVCGGESGGG